MSGVTARSYRVGAVKAVVFCDEVRRGLSVRRAVWVIACHSDTAQDTLCWSMGECPSVTTYSRPLHEWIGIVCEYRVFMYDYVTHKVTTTALHLFSRAHARLG